VNTEVYEGEKLLAGKTVFLSASKPSRDEELFPPAVESEIEEGVRCLSRAVFAEGGRLVFGAHPSISPLIVDVATEYFPPRWENNEEDRPVAIYQSKAFRDVIPAATRALESLGYAHIELTEIQNGEHYDPGLPPREQCLESLAHMRRRMFDETGPAAMVAIGGMQGVIREARLFLETCGGNVYAMTTLGGAASRLPYYLETNLLQEEKPIQAWEWRQRLIPIEKTFESVQWNAIRRESRAQLPAHPYALLMQRIVRHIAGEVEES
jgi:hypothetical protein